MTASSSTIAILGAGNVGAALARNLARSGDRVYFGVPEPEKYAELAAGLGARIGSVADAVAASDIAILAVPYSAAIAIVAITRVL